MKCGQLRGHTLIISNKRYNYPIKGQATEQETEAKITAACYKHELSEIQILM